MKSEPQKEPFADQRVESEGHLASPAVPMKKPVNTWNVLRNRNYALLFWGQLISATGTQMQVVAVAWQVYLLRVRSIESRFAAVLVERNRIAREIHDSLAQGLAGISLQLELVAKMLSGSTDTARNHLNQARMLARQSLADARRSLWDLRSGGPESSDLPTSLTTSARHLTAQTGVQTQLQVSGTFRELDQHIESNLLRIGQEAIANAVKHAGAQRIDISLDFDTNIVRLSVRDNGRGFDCNHAPTPAEGHFGLVGMRERAEQIGGRLTVSSTPGCGTQVSAEVPVRN